MKLEGPYIEGKCSQNEQEPVWLVPCLRHSNLALDCVGMQQTDGQGHLHQRPGQLP